MHAQNDGRCVWTKTGDAGAMPLADARDHARSHMAASRTGDSSCPAETAAESAFEDVADAAFHRQSRHWKPGTLDANRRHLKNQILPRFRGQPIGAIASADVQQWFASLRATPRTFPPVIGGIRLTGKTEKGSSDLDADGGSISDTY